MMPDKKVVLIVGATSLVEQETLRLLLKDKTISSLTVLARRPYIGPAGPAKLNYYQVNFNDSEGYKQFFGTDIVLCSLGTTMKKAGSKTRFYEVDFRYPYKIAKVARSHNCRQFILISSLNADADSHLFYYQIKGKLENTLKEINFDNLTLTRPSLILGHRDEFSLGKEVAKLLSLIFRFLLPIRYQPVHARQIARAVIDATRQIFTRVQIIESHTIRKLLL